MEERFAHSELVAVEHRSPQQSLDHIPGFLRPWVNVFMDREGAGTDVVGDAAQPATIVAFIVIFRTANLGFSLHDREQDIDVEVGRYALEDARGPLQPHPGIDVLARQWTEIIRWVANPVELGEDQIPDLNVLAVFEGVVDFGTWSADTIGALARCARRPKVIRLVHPRDPGHGNPDLFVPNRGRLIVILVDGDRQPFRWNAEPLLVGQELPCPRDRFVLEVIAKAEIPEHLEEGMVIRGSSDVVDIARAKALLASRRSGKVEFHFAQKVVLELVHPRRSEQNRWIPSRYEDVAGLAMVAFGLEKRQVFFA